MLPRESSAEIVAFLCVCVRVCEWEIKLPFRYFVEEAVASSERISFMTILCGMQNPRSLFLANYNMRTNIVEYTHFEMYSTWAHMTLF